MATMEKPILFIQEINGKFTINHEAVKLLTAIEEQVVVVAIVGKYRTGKSFLMNRLFGRSSGFTLGATVQSHTKGFWLWCRPHPVHQGKRLILIDTEGLCDVEKGDRTYDTKLFSLALLLCSCLVYNSMGTIDNEALQQLHFVTELTEHIKISAEKEEEGNDFDRYFPPFYWVVRDFMLEMKIDGKPCSEDDYLEHALTLKKGRGRNVEDFNRPREYIRDFFPKRKCFVLCKPVDDDEKIKRIETLSDKELKPAFLANANRVCKTILEEAGIFKVGVTPINGPRLLFLAERYVEAINSGAVPCIGTAVDMMRDSECQKAVDRALAAYINEMDSRVRRHQLPMNPQDLSFENVTVQTMALQTYHAAALFDGTGTYQEKLQNSLKEHFRIYVQSNEEKSRQRCREILREWYGSVQRNIQQSQYSGKGCYKAYKHDYDQVIRKYHETQNKGPCAEEILQEFVRNKESEGMTILANDKAMTKKEKEVAELQEKRIKEEQARKASDEKARQLQRKLADTEQSNLIMMQQAQDDFDQKLKQVQQDNQEALEARENEYQRLLEEGQQRQAELHKEAVEEMRKDQEDLAALHQERIATMQESIQRQENLVEQIHNNPPEQKSGVSLGPSTADGSGTLEWCNEPKSMAPSLATPVTVYGIHGTPMWN